jgi:hypothetical protein
VIPASPIEFRSASTVSELGNELVELLAWRQLLIGHESYSPDDSIACMTPYPNRGGNECPLVSRPLNQIRLGLPDIR